MQHITPVGFSCSQKIAIAFGSAALTCTLGLCALPSAAHAVTAAEKQAEAEEALANLTAMQETLDKLSADYGEAVMAQEEAEKKHSDAEKRITEIKEELGDLQGQLNERAREMYRAGGVPFLDIVLGANSFEEFATSLDMANKVNQSNADMIDQQRGLKKEAEEQEAILEEQAEVAAQKSDEAAQAAEQAEATVAEMQNTYDSLSAEAAQLLEEERKAREAEEAARAAAVLEAAKKAAEEEERARAAAEAEQQAQEQAQQEAEEQAQQDEADAQDAVEGEGEDSADEGNADEGNEAGAEEQQEEPAPAYEGGGDTVSRAYACLGAPYVWGGVGPEGYDCSGLVSYCLTGEHSRLGTTYTFMDWPTVSDPQPGDVCVNWGHTGIYIGDGQMIHAATYGVGVIVGPVQDGMKIVRY